MLIMAAKKTNKLGSKVTVAGDGTNIDTTITQTGDDTTIKVALGQDINVNTVTATKTVKAGTATMGNQAVTDNKSATQMVTLYPVWTIKIGH